MRGIITAIRDGIKPLLFNGWNGKQLQERAMSEAGYIVHNIPGTDGGTIQPSSYESQIAAYKGPVHASLSLVAKQVGDATLRIYKPKRRNESKLYRTITREIKPHKKMQLLEKAAPGSALSLSDDAVEVVAGHRLIDLLQRVNPDTDIYQLQNVSAGYLGLIGNEYWILIKDGLGIPTSIISAPGEFMKVKQGPDGWVSGYVYKRGSTKREFGTDEVIHMKAPAPGAAFMAYGRGDLMGAADDFNLLQHMYQFEGAIFRNGGMPNTLLSVQGNWTQDQRDAFQAQYEQRYSGSGKAGKLMVGEGGVKVEHLSYSPKDLLLQSNRKFANEQIYSNFSTPVAMFSAQAANRAQLEASDWQTLKYAVKPILTLIQQALNAQLVPLYKDPIYVEYDDVVPNDIAFELEEDTSLTESGIVAINEVRSRRGMAPVDGGDVPYINMNKIPIGTEVERASPAVIEDMVDQAMSKARQRYRGNG